MTRAAWAEISAAAFQHNLRRVRASAPHSRMAAIIKANGYGHGIVRAARALSDADMFGVASIDEALELRAAGIRQSVLLLEGVFEAGEIPVAQREGFNVVVHHNAQLDMIERADLSSSQPLHAWLKVDTGMHRLGFAPAQFDSARARLQNCGGVAGDVVVMSHLARADERRSDATDRQTAEFERVTGALGTPRSLANSAGILAWPRTHFDWVRPGIMLYGISPFDDSVGTQEGLRPAMTVKSRLIAVNRHARGDAIGYGGTWTCPEDMPVGVVAFGYGDGYPRHAANGTPVLVNGQRVPLIGRVSMDMITVDLRTQSNAKVGDVVVLWGDGLPVEEIARGAQTIAYELVCGIKSRVRIVEIP
jgi:alanine racemase